MKIEEAIAHYLDTRTTAGLRLSTVETMGRALRTVFESVLAEDIVILTADPMDELRARLGKREGRRGTPLLGRTKDLYWSTAQRFLKWCVQQRLLTADPLAPRKVTHIGQLARWLREAAGLSRQDLAQQTGWPIATIRNFEAARSNLSREQLLQLLLQPSMTRLPEQVKEAGLDLGLGNNGVGEA